MLPVYGGFPRIRGPTIDPKTVGLLLQGNPPFIETAMWEAILSLLRLPSYFPDYGFHGFREEAFILKATRLHPSCWLSCKPKRQGPCIRPLRRCYYVTCNHYQESYAHLLHEPTIPATDGSSYISTVVCASSELSRAIFLGFGQANKGGGGGQPDAWCQTRLCEAPFGMGEDCGGSEQLCWFREQA